MAELSDIVFSDVSLTMSARQLPVKWISAFLSHPDVSKLDLFLRVGKNYIQFQRTRDPKLFYQTLEGLPFMEDLSFVERIPSNPNWDKIIQKLKPRTVFIVSQDDSRVVEAYLNSPHNQYRFKQLNTKVKVVATNRALHENGFYTGEAEINVTPEKLVYYAMIGIPFIGDGYVSKALKKFPELKRNLIRV